MDKEWLRVPQKGAHLIGKLGGGKMATAVKRGGGVKEETV